MSGSENTEINHEQQDRFVAAVRLLLPQFDISELTHPGNAPNETLGAATYQLDPTRKILVSEDIPDIESNDSEVVAYLIHVEEAGAKSLETSEAFAVSPDTHITSYELTNNVESTHLMDQLLEKLALESTLGHNPAGAEVVDYASLNSDFNTRLGRAIMGRILAEELGLHTFTVAHFEKIMPLLELCGPHNKVLDEDV